MHICCINFGGRVKASVIFALRKKLWNAYELDVNKETPSWLKKAIIYVIKQHTTMTFRDIGEIFEADRSNMGWHYREYNRKRTEKKDYNLQLEQEILDIIKGTYDHYKKAE